MGKAGQAKGNKKLRANEQAERQLELDAAPSLMGAGEGRDIAGVVIAVVAVASLIAVVSPASAPVTAAVAGFYHLGFGLGAYVLPLALLAVAALLFLHGGLPVSGRTALGAGIVFIAVLTLLSLSVPGTDMSTTGMFEPTNLAASGGYLGAWVAATLQGALGKVISIVVALGLAALGLVIVGYSVGDAVRGIAERAAGIADRRRADVNDNPWGEPVPEVEASLARPARSRPRARRGAQEALDLEGAQKTTYLGARETTVLEDSEDDPDESPFVEVGEAAEDSAGTAKTILMGAKERMARAGRRAKKARADKEAAAEDAGALDAPEAVELAPWEDAPAEATPTAAVAKPAAKTTVLDASTGEQRDIPDFLKPATPAAGSQAVIEGLDADPAGDADDAPRLPPASMLHRNPQSAKSASTAKELEQTAGALQSTLQEFGLRSSVVGWIAGPTVTTFKVQPGEGERVSRINSLEDDIALTLATDSVRIFAPIPGTSLVGIEIPNRTRQTVGFGDILPYVKGGPLEFALGRDAEGAPMVADLAKMPHLLIAGTTGSGKSVVISSIVMSLLMRTFPEDVRLIMIDPKRVEFAPYDGLPHLYVPVVTEPKQAASALQWAVSEMERRLKIFERIGVRKIATFNEKQAAGEFEKYDNPPAKMPYLVIVIDELSDLMMVAGKDVEASIVRIAQLGRAAGIHMIVATQRPSSNVVTGLIKANITNRIGLTVATGIDSRVILDQTGAEKLTGQGDMLFSRVDWGKPKRIQGCYVSDEEIVSVVDFVKEHSHVEYHEEILSAVAPAAMGGGGMGSSEPAEDDPLLWDAARIVVDSQLGSTSGLQRRLKVGYARAGRIMDMLEEKGVVGPPDGSKPREVLLDMEALQALEALESPLTEEELGGGF